jgi:hypothetical protein
MAHDDDDLRIRPGKVRDRGGLRPGGRRAGGVRTRPTSFAGQMQQAIRRAGGNPYRLSGTGKGSGRFNARGRGAAVAAALKNRSPWSRDGGVRTQSRRVAVKARVVKLNPQHGAARGRQFVSAKAVDAHLRYLERDGVTKDGEKGQVYSAERDVEDGRAFVERGRGDRHQFRFIVSAEDGVELSDPRATTRDLMARMEATSTPSSIGSRSITTTPDTRTPTSSSEASPATARPSTSRATTSPTASGSGRARSSPWSWAGRPSRRCRTAWSGRSMPTASPGWTGC